MVTDLQSEADTFLYVRILQMLMDLGKPTYEEDFERHFLAAAADFYAKEAQEFISTCNAPDYMRKVCAWGRPHESDSAVNDTHLVTADIGVLSLQPYHPPVVCVNFMDVP